VKQEQITAMANIMVEARRENEDVGKLVAAALQDAAEKLDSELFLVSGRPGSWEADIILRMARQGGSGNQERIDALSALFVEMGEANEDGGDVVSQAMSQAVDTLGSLNEFAEFSEWYWDLTNLGRQYSSHWND
jgi:hypothetical protein